jgi:FixJ family two-component response regulator
LPNRKAVLIVDDDPSLLRGLERLLRKHGFHVISFDTAAGLRNHRDFGQARCIVLDIDLGSESGIELRIQLRDAGLPVPVIYITGNDSQAIRRAAMESGCLAYLVKPFAISSLIHSIEQT